jgi:GDP-L-fucose synthase
MPATIGAMSHMEKNSKIIITGGSGLVGTALTTMLCKKGFTNVHPLSSKECDLTDYSATLALFEQEKPEYVYHLAAAVYGIMGNMMNKGSSFLKNTLINLSVVEASRRINVKKITAMGSGCVYPFPSPGLPLSEDMVWLGKPHPSEDSYAHSKRALLAQLNAYNESYATEFAFVISANLYGPNDKFDIEQGHVIPSLVRKFHDAKINDGEVTVWGDGSSKRDFMYSEDAAEALLVIMENLSGPVNLGSGMVHPIRDLVECLTDITDLHGRVRWDRSKPNGQDYRAYDLNKLFDVGFTPKVKLHEGLRRTFNWYADNTSAARI